MIKKIFTSIIIYIFLIGSSYAFLGEGNGFNLYSDIEKGMTDLQIKNFKYEISGGGKGISKEINKILKSKHQKECIKDGLNIKDFKLIVGGNTNILIKNLKNTKGCLYKGSIDNKTINDLMGTIVTIDLVYKQKANNKSDDIYKISRIGIYSDGNLSNSTFDLISDIEDIDKIIFTKEIPYNGEEIGNSDNNFANFLKGNIKPLTIKKNNISNNGTLNKANNINGISNSNSTINNKGSLNSNSTINSTFLSPIKSNNNTSYVCSQDNQNSGFNAQTLASIIPKNQIGNGTLSEGKIKEILKPGTISTKNKINTTNNINNTISNNNLLKSNLNNNILGAESNSSNNWPCNTFFCIIISFETYSQNSFGGGSNLSIESYMNISNGHLKKFSGTSLVQSKMTVNQFELGLKNLHLADMFHMGVIMTKKSPPIIHDNKRKPGEYKKRLREYYKNNDANYDRRNSLVIYKGEENELRTISDSAELPIITVKERDKYLKNRQALESKQNKLVENEFDHKILYEDMDIFYKKFIPLESFTKNILNYSQNINTLIKGMNNKPSN